MILLDTHVVIWLVADPRRLSPRARDTILRARVSGEPIAFSPVSFFEIAYAVHRNRLSLTVPTTDFIAEVEARLVSIPITASIARCAAELPDPFHGDPMDRLIAASAIIENCALVTHDDRIRRAKVCNIIW